MSLLFWVSLNFVKKLPHLIYLRLLLALYGKHNSVYTLLKDYLPKLQLVKCMARSLHFASNKAADVLPSQLDFIAKETYNWFSIVV